MLLSLPIALALLHAAQRASAADCGPQPVDSVAYNAWVVCEQALASAAAQSQVDVQASKNGQPPAAVTSAVATTLSTTTSAVQNGATGGGGGSSDNGAYISSADPALVASGAGEDMEFTYYAESGQSGTACGGSVDEDGGYTVAMNQQIWNAAGCGPNGNACSLCGRKISIQGPDGNMHEAKINDLCPNPSDNTGPQCDVVKGCCHIGQIDLSDEFFDVVAPGRQSEGRIVGGHWEFV